MGRDSSGTAVLSACGAREHSGSSDRRRAGAPVLLRMFLSGVLESALFFPLHRVQQCSLDLFDVEQVRMPSCLTRVGSFGRRGIADLTFVQGT